LKIGPLIPNEGKSPTCLILSSSTRRKECCCLHAICPLSVASCVAPNDSFDL